MTETKTILLIGRSGRGKSTLANVILNKNDNFEEIFKESSKSISETKRIQFEQFKDEDIDYLVIDTPGIGDTKMSDNEVLDIIAEAVYLARDGLSQVLFVVDGRFDQYEMATYNILRTIIFDENVTKQTTVVRTNFADFRSKEKREEDIESMKKATQPKRIELEKKIVDKEKKMQKLFPDSEQYQELLTKVGELKKELKSTLSEIIESCQSRIIHVDNPKSNKKVRTKSRIKLLEHLNKTCQEDYKPEKLEELSKDIADDMDKLLRSRRELEVEMQKLKTGSGSANNKFSNIFKESDKIEPVPRKEQEFSAEQLELPIKFDNLSIGKVKELEDKKARLKKEIADKEKVIRQKVLKHIFNNISDISNELGGDIFLESVVGEHKWENISSEFSSKELVIRWLSQKFDYEQVQKWKSALGNNFHPEHDAGFCAWLRDDKKLTVEKKELLVHVISNIEQLRREYQQHLVGEVDLLAERSRQLTQDEDWTDIHPDFHKISWNDKTYQQDWEKRGLTYQDAQKWIAAGFEQNDWWEVNQWKDHDFTPQQVKSWLSIGLNKWDFEFAFYLREKNYQPSPDLKLKLEQLRAEFNVLFNKTMPAQEYLDQNYPKKQRSTITELDINNKNLTGNLGLNDFVNLEDLDCSGNQLTQMDLSNCNQLSHINCHDNNLESIKLPQQVEKLISFNIKYNSFPEQDLSMVSKMVNLVRTDLSYNKFRGSLKPLQRMSKLEWLDIRNTNIDSGLEYLPSNLKSFYCSPNERKESKCQIIANLLESTEGSYFSQKLREYKQKFQEQSQQTAQILQPTTLSFNPNK